MAPATTKQVAASISPFTPTNATAKAHTVVVCSVAASVWIYFVFQKSGSRVPMKNRVFKSAPQRLVRLNAQKFFLRNSRKMRPVSQPMRRRDGIQVTRVRHRLICTMATPKALAPKTAGEAEDEAEKGARGRTQDNGTHNNWYGHEGDFKTGGLDIADRGDRHEYLNGEEYGYFYVVEGLFIDTFFSHSRAPFLS